MRTTNLMICMALLILSRSPWVYSSEDAKNVSSATETELEPRSGPGPAQLAADSGPAQQAAEINGSYLFDFDRDYPKDFNFHNKTLFLKEQVKKLVQCIQDSLEKYKDRPRPLPFPETLLKVRANISRTTGGKKVTTEEDIFAFRYNGSRGFKDTCLGDGYKRDILQRLYDGGCMSYEQKIKYLNSFSCNASENLECRQVSEERDIYQYAAQDIPYMICTCADYDTPQSNQSRKIKGFYDDDLRMCVLTVGQKCKFEPQGLDKRFHWDDHDYIDNVTNKTGIEVYDQRPIHTIYPCVNHAFCYTKEDRQGLQLDGIYENRCVCKHGYFEGGSGYCKKGMEDPPKIGIALAAIYILIATVAFLTGMTSR